MLTFTVFSKIVSFDEKHHGSIEFFMSVYDAQEVSRISLGKNLRES